jgi:hypothetical protein
MIAIDSDVIAARRSAIAKAALSMRGMDTSRLPGTNNGDEACAMTVQLVLKKVFGHEFVAGTQDDVWVPDLTKGLTAAHWLIIDNPAQAIAGDIAVQNGQRDGGPSGDSANPYENHIGVVVVDPDNDELAILNNSSSTAHFWNMDLSLRFAGYYSGVRDGAPRFYRYNGGD